MIAASELRVGNWVNRVYYDENILPNKINGYDFWHSEMLESVNHKVEWESLQPIQLTEEVLLKCGFTQFKIEGQYKSLKWTLEDNQFNLNTDFFYLVFIKQYGKNKGKRMFEVRRWGIKLVAIDYLHQLQNLYFALTGKELEVKL